MAIEAPETDMEKTAPVAWPSQVRIGAIVAAALALLWFVGAQGFASIVSRTDNVSALSAFDPTAHPAPGNRLARIYVLDGQLDRAVPLARAAALGDPMNVRVVRNLGLALHASDKDPANRVMRAAEKLSWRDTATTMWAMRDAALRSEIPRIMDQLDALARRQVEPEATRQLFYAGLADAPSRAAFSKVLATNPPWRGAFFADARTRLSPRSYGQMQQLLDLLDRSRAPTTALERMTFIDRMVDTGNGAMAHAYWARTFGIPQEERDQLLHDRTFASLARRTPDTPVSPFEWKMGPDAGSLVTTRQEGARSMLDLTPGASEPVSLIVQTLLLPPGRHRIDAAVVQGSAMQAPAEWQIVCSSGRSLIRSFTQRGNGLSGVEIIVPPSDCGSQTLKLESVDRLDAQPVTLGSVTVR